MYGLDVSNLIQATIRSEIVWMPFPLPIMRANCGFLYDVDLVVRYGTDSHPNPGTTDSIVLVKEGQLLHCNAVLYGSYYLSHPVTCNIKDSNGEAVFTKTKWLVAGAGPETEFFRNVSLPAGSYDVEWDVCDGHASHKLTVSALPSEYVTNYIDVGIVVTDTEGINAQSTWDAIKEDVLSEMLVYKATVELVYAKIEGKYLIVFHLKVTAPPEGGIGSIAAVGISTIILLALIVAIVTLAVAIPAISRVWIAQLAYNTTMQEYTYEDCAAMTYNEWIACMAATYPDVWAKIKDKVEFPKPPPPPPDWMTYVTYGVIAIFGLAGLYIGVKYILPAIKAK